MLCYTYLLYNRMASCKESSFYDDEFDESIHQKVRVGSNSGYLD